MPRRTKDAPAPSAAFPLDHRDEPSGEEPRKDHEPGTDQFLALTHAQIRPSPDNARKSFVADALDALAETILLHGLLQPIVVSTDASGGVPARSRDEPSGEEPRKDQEPSGEEPRKDQEPSGEEQRQEQSGEAPTYIIVAGERRWRAIGLLIERGHWPAARPIAARLESGDERRQAEAALIENLQRVDLDHMEMAHAFEALGTRFHLSNKLIAKHIGRSPEFVQQHRRLAQLEPALQDAVRAGDLTLHEALAIVARPRPASLGPAAMLALAEIVHKCAGDYHTECAFDADGGALEQLTTRGLVRFTARDWTTQRALIVPSWQGREVIDAAPRADAGEDFLAALRHAADVPPPPAGQFSTPWLNGPFALHPEAEAELARRQQANAAAKAQAEAALKEIRGLQASLGAEPVTLARARFRALLGDFTGPFTATNSGRVVDARGAPFARADWSLPDIGNVAHLIAFALNFASYGEALPAPDPAEEPPQPSPADEADSYAEARMDAADVGEDDPDAEVPGYLRRLA